jgi:hypothetical protein
MEMFYILIVTVATLVYVFVESHWKGYVDQVAECLPKNLSSNPGIDKVIELFT